MFHYFVPVDSGGVSETRLAEVGLGSVLGDATVSRREVAEGPGGLRGMLLVGTSGESVVPRYEAGEREWVEIPSGYWLGWDPKALPGPEKLARKRVLAGHEVVLGDGKPWLVPTLRKATRMPGVPMVLGMTPGGELIGAVAPGYDEIYARGLRVVEIFTRLGQGEKVELLLSEQFQMAVEFLSINYRVGIAEASALGVITTANMEEIFQAVIDWPALLEMGELLEKKSVESESTTSG